MNTIENNSEELFTRCHLNRDVYDKDFLPVYKKLDFVPNRIFQTMVFMPFEVPLEDGTCVTMAMEENEAITLVFSAFHSKHKFFFDSDIDSLKIDVSKTIVELNYVSDKSKFDAEIENDSQKNELSKLFDTCIEKLNFFLTSYLITTKDVSVYQVSLKMFDIVGMYRFLNPNNWEFQPGMLLLHLNNPYKKVMLSNEQAKEIIWYANIINQEWNPFVLPLELKLNSFRFFLNGQFREAVLYCQTAFETFLRTLLSEIYKQEGKSSLELEETYEKSGFLGTLKREFSPRIGGIWDITNVNSPLKDWYENCYQRRNRIIHGGYLPNNTETEKSLDSTENAIVYVSSLVKQKKKKYPDIYKYLNKD
jgi:hypothetical protein